MCKSEESVQEQQQQKKLTCEYLVLYFSIHSANCINRWCLLGTSGYNWPSSFPVHFPASPWIFLLFPLNHSTLNSALSSAFLLLGTVLPTLYRLAFPSLLLTWSSQPEFVCSCGTRDEDEDISKGQSSGLPPVVAGLLFFFYLVIRNGAGMVLRLSSCIIHCVLEVAETRCSVTYACLIFGTA